MQTRNYASFILYFSPSYIFIYIILYLFIPKVCMLWGIPKSNSLSVNSIWANWTDSGSHTFTGLVLETQKKTTSFLAFERLKTCDDLRAGLSNRGTGGLFIGTVKYAQTGRAVNSAQRPGELLWNSYLCPGSRVTPPDLWLYLDKTPP